MHLYVADTGVGWSVVYLAWTIIGLITSIGGILYATPFFVVAIIHIAALYLYIQVRAFLQKFYCLHIYFMKLLKYLEIC